MLSDPIVSMIIVSATGILALALKLCYSSKCKSFKFCGSEIIRDTEHEIEVVVNNTNTI